ncbi:hypothetical protein TSMEX_008065 [Taenia solium]|eukprot:TsM_000227400 transcript=TsM_000227400 gene=TsM_000227400
MPPAGVISVQCEIGILHFTFSGDSGFSHITLKAPRVVPKRHQLWIEDVRKFYKSSEREKGRESKKENALYTCAISQSQLTLYSSCGCQCLMSNIKFPTVVCQSDKISFPFQHHKATDHSGCQHVSSIYGIYAA